MDKRERIKNIIWGSKFVNRIGGAGFVEVDELADQILTALEPSEEEIVKILENYKTCEGKTLIEIFEKEGCSGGALGELYDIAHALAGKIDEPKSESPKCQHSGNCQFENTVLPLPPEPKSECSCEPTLNPLGYGKFQERIRCYVCGGVITNGLNLIDKEGKPLPEKEPKRFGDICENCGCEKSLHNCPECGMKQEPEKEPRKEECGHSTHLDKEIIGVGYNNGIRTTTFKCLKCAEVWSEKEDKREQENLRLVKYQIKNLLSQSWYNADYDEMADRQQKKMNEFLEDNRDFINALAGILKGGEK